MYKGGKQIEKLLEPSPKALAAILDREV